MNRARLEASLRETFGPEPGSLRVVVRQAMDLAESGQYADDTGTELTVAELVEHLGDAPDERLVDRWNWWVGSLELAYGGYAEFEVRRWQAE
ncbi:hypothetical protein N0B31_16220 [Salinirubellus salinus]|uniref:Uncharacterized protein n=1 Tax=Salinirubellus salinus TaxID=1364945 RepID=A0A9E7U3W9_9EURY|nr:hypothetical protein [Salinirubellus salinus]UWM53670.1 hypothetical protein N0B31_16220 [Salinirubellus salinus]